LDFASRRLTSAEAPGEIDRLVLLAATVDAPERLIREILRFLCEP